VLLEQHDRVSEAREAYGRALQEDIAFYPAHVRLGLLALNAKDTSTAISELDLAAQVAGTEPYVRRGSTLVRAMRVAIGLGLGVSCARVAAPTTPTLPRGPGGTEIKR